MTSLPFLKHITAIIKLICRINTQCSIALHQLNFMEAVRALRKLEEALLKYPLNKETLLTEADLVTQPTIISMMFLMEEVAVRKFKKKLLLVL